MPSLPKLVLSLAVLVSSAAFADVPKGEVTIRTRDGSQLVGRVVTETAKGYLLVGSNGSRVVAFEDIVDLREVPPQPPALPLPPEPQFSQPVTRVAATFVDDWPSRREGFHFGLGVSGMLLPFEVNFSAKIHLNWGFGRLALDVSPRLGVLAVPGGAAVNLGVDTQFRFSLGEYFAMGVGIDQGFLSFSGYYAGLSVTPALITLGDRGQHQISLWVAVPILNIGYGSFHYPIASLGYAYFF